MGREFTGLVISGGGLKMVSVIGVLKKIFETHDRDKLIHFVGTSAGAILCTCLVLGFTIQDMISFLKEVAKLDEATTFSVDEIFGLIDNYGLNSGAPLDVILVRLLKFKGYKDDITFMDVAKMTGKNLVICVSNVSKQQDEFMCVDTAPTMPVRKALRMSCSIPILLTPVIHAGDTYVDGCLFNNFPISYFKNHSMKDVIGINISTQNYAGFHDFMGFMRSMLFALMDKVTSYANREYRESSLNNIMSIELKEDQWIQFDTMKVTLSDEKIDGMINEGYRHESLQN